MVKFRTFLHVALVSLSVAWLAGCVVDDAAKPEEDGVKPAAVKDEADEKINKASALNDYIALANGYMRDGKREQALRAIKRGMEIDSKSAELLNVMAMYYVTDGEFELADKEYKKAIRADSKYTATYLNYGVYLYRQNRIDEACKMLKKATEDVMYPKRGAAFLNYGVCLKQQGKVAEAEEAFRRSNVNDPRNPLVMLELAHLKFDIGEFDQSLQLYNRFLGMSRQNARSLWLGIRLMHVAGDLDKQASYELLLKNQFPGSPEYKEFVNWSATR